MSQAAYKAMFGFLTSALSGSVSSSQANGPFTGFEAISLLGASEEPVEFAWRSVDLKIIAGLRAMTFTDSSLKAISKAALRDLWGRLFGLLRADFDRVTGLRGRILQTKAELFSGLLALQGTLPPVTEAEKEVLPRSEPLKPTRKRDAAAAGLLDDAGEDKGGALSGVASEVASHEGSYESSDEDGDVGEGGLAVPSQSGALCGGKLGYSPGGASQPVISAVQVKCPGCSVLWLAQQGIPRPLGDLCVACGARVRAPVAGGPQPLGSVGAVAGGGGGELLNPFALLSGLDVPGAVPLEDRVGWAASGRFRSFFFGPGAVGYSPGCVKAPPPSVVAGIIRDEIPDLAAQLSCPPFKADFERLASLSTPWSWQAFVPGGVIRDPAGLALALTNVATLLSLFHNDGFRLCFDRAIKTAHTWQYSGKHSVEGITTWSTQALVFFLNDLSVLLFADAKPTSGCTRDFFRARLPIFGFPSRADKLEVLTQLLATDAVSVDTARALAVHWAAAGTAPSQPGGHPGPIAADVPSAAGKRRGGKSRNKKPRAGEAAAGPPVPAGGDNPRRRIKHAEKIPVGASSGKKLCLDFSHGVCKRGAACHWGHDRSLSEEELKAVYDE